MKYLKYLILCLLFITVGNTQVSQTNTKTRNLVPTKTNYYDVGRTDRPYDSLFVNNISMYGGFMVTADGDTIRFDAGTELYMLDIEVGDVRMFAIDSTGNVIFGGLTPTAQFIDMDGTDGDVSASIGINDTDTGSGTEDTDVLFSAQVAGSDVGFMSFDADGDFFLRSGGGSDTQLVLDSGGGVGIGTASPDGTLHVQSGSAGAVTASTIADDLIVESNTSSGINILTPNANSSTLGFGSVISNIGAKIQWKYGAGGISKIFNLGTTITGSSLVLRSGLNVDAIEIDGNQDVSIGAGTPVTGVQLLLPQEDDAVTPTLAFGTGGDGLYSAVNNEIDISLNGSLRWKATVSYFGSVVANGARLYYNNASATVPSVVPNAGDVDVGLGSGSTDQLSLIAGGVEGIRLTENTGVLQTLQLNAGLTADVGSVQGGQPLTSSYNEISVCANVGDAITLPTAAAGQIVTIMNNGANACDVFPASGDDLGAGVDTAVSLAADTNITYFAIDATSWEVI